MNPTKRLKENRDLRIFLKELREAARLSLTDEVAATPKPGLVDRHDSGAHTDMDYRTFEASIQAIVPYIEEMAAIGTAGERAARLFASLRPAGIRAEKAMFAATGGVNTHKGIIFSMGLAAAAAGSLFYSRYGIGPESGGRNREEGGPMFRPDMQPLKAEEILSLCREMCRTSMEHDFSCIDHSMPKTHGELLYVRYGCRGIRGEAADGFPALGQFGLPALREYQNRHPETGTEEYQNRLSLHILLTLMANVDDTNILFRTDHASLEYAKRCALSVLSLGGGDTPAGIEALRRLNDDFITRNISPGGCADLLSMTLFLRRLELIFASFDRISLHEFRKE